MVEREYKSKRVDGEEEIKGKTQRVERKGEKAFGLNWLR